MVKEIWRGEIRHYDLYTDSQFDFDIDLQFIAHLDTWGILRQAEGEY